LIRYVFYIPIAIPSSISLIMLLQWVDEDEQNEAPEDDYMNNFGGQGMGEDGGFGGIDFSKLGAGGAGMPDMGTMGDQGEDDEDEDDDEDMPELEDEADEADGKGKGKAAEEKPKIEEVA
jgi:hypothetical protein